MTTAKLMAVVRAADALPLVPPRASLLSPGTSGRFSHRLTNAGNAPANVRLDAANQGGDAFVLKASPKFEVLATNSIGEATIASMAVSNGDLFVRTHKALWCFRESRK